MEFETIAALATPPGNSGVAVIRISGSKSKQILQEMIGEKLDFEPRKMYLKNVKIKNYADRCLVVFFASPFSYTGEDTAEIQSHGGYFLAQSIIEEALKHGARLATAGEFSKRAFLNGKLSLDQAEGIMDLINAETDMQAQSGSVLLQGKLKENIINYQAKLTDILAEIEAKLDYPEYEYTESETSNIIKNLTEISSELNALVKDSENGLLIKNGVKIAIVGAPNVGKSSLLNALTKTEKAIVTNIAGTTRDVIEAEYVYNGIIFRLFDTAGIHESADEVEQIGIKRAIKAIDECDLVLRLSEPNAPCTIKTTKPHIDVLNKADLCSPVIAQDFDHQNPVATSQPEKPATKSSTNTNLDSTTSSVIARSASDVAISSINISAKTGENIEALKQLIFNSTISHKIDSNKMYLTNTRHIECIKNALNSINNAIKIFNSTTMDIISSEIKSAWLTLGEISGTTTNEAIIDRIFSKFCLGK